MEIKKVYQELMPKVKLVGKRYTSQDRDETGTFASYWQKAFREGWFALLEGCKGIPGVSADYLGVMRMNGDAFEYWIGMFLAPDAEIPAEFEAVEIPAGKVGVCWLYGNEKNGEI